MKITVYTITDCEFSKQEKEYLASHQLQYEEKNLETNKEFLTEMLAVSNNFAGTPVTKIEKDDGQIVILKGFTKDEFDKTLRLTPVEEPAAKTETQKPVGEKVAPLPTTVELVAQPADTQPVNPTDSNRPADTSAGPIPTDSKPSPAPTIPDFPAKT